jgi:hypothetical protein
MQLMRSSEAAIAVICRRTSHEEELDHLAINEPDRVEQYQIRQEDGYEDVACRLHLGYRAKVLCRDD